MRYSMPPTAALSHGGSHRNLDVPFVRSCDIPPDPTRRIAGKRTVKGFGRKVYTFDPYSDMIMRQRSVGQAKLGEVLMIGELIDLDQRVWVVTDLCAKCGDHGTATGLSPVRMIMDANGTLPPPRRFKCQCVPKVKIVKGSKLSDAAPGMTRQEMEDHLRSLAESALGIKITGKLTTAAKSAIRDFEATMIAEAAYAA